MRNDNDHKYNFLLISSDMFKAISCINFVVLFIYKV